MLSSPQRVLRIIAVRTVEITTDAATAAASRAAICKLCLHITCRWIWQITMTLL